MTIKKFKKHSDAVKFMMGYYVNICGYKIVRPLGCGVFSVAHKENNIILTLLDNKTIKASDRYTKFIEYLSDNDYQLQHDDYYDILSDTDQGE